MVRKDKNIDQDRAYCMDGNGHVLPTQQVVLQMIVDDMKALQKGQTEARHEFREEFNRVKDKMDSLRDDVAKKHSEYDKDIARLTTQATIAGRTSGAIWGTGASLAVSLGVMFLKMFFEAKVI